MAEPVADFPQPLVLHGGTACLIGLDFGFWIAKWELRWCTFASCKPLLCHLVLIGKKSRDSIYLDVYYRVGSTPSPGPTGLDSIYHLTSPQPSPAKLATSTHIRTGPLSEDGRVQDRLASSHSHTHDDSSKSPFDIVQAYHSLLASDPLLTMPIAAIESLILLLSHSPPSTIFETLSLLATYTNTLKSFVANPIALSSGTDLFQRYLISTLQSQQRSNTGKSGKGGARDDFQATRNHLISNGRLFVSRAKEARTQIAALARRFIRDDTVVLTCGSSRVVSAVFDAALKTGTRFKLVYVSDPASKKSSSTLPQASADMPVAVISPNAVAHALPRCTLVLLGAESVVENGGIISGMGTYQLGVLAKAAGKPVYVCAESFKFVRMFPLSQEDVGGDVLRFSEDEKGEKKEDAREGAGGVAGDGQVDYTPPELITALVTETGVHTPSAVSEELIKIWY